MASSTRTKKKTITNVTLETAQQASQDYAVSQNKLSKIEAEMNKKINDIKSKYQEDITTLKEALDEPMEILEVFAKEQQESWGKKKSLDLLHCIIGFRTTTPKVDKDKKFTWDAVSELLQKYTAFKDFVRTKTEINKDAILACKDDEVLKSLKNECYIEIKQDETFYVEAKKEEVVAA
jgi:phage host-nuclease inhibitor protein Gam